MEFLLLLLGIYVYAIRAVGQEDFKDIDEKGNIIKKQA